MQTRDKATTPSTTKAPDILNATHSGSIENSVNTANQSDVNTVDVNAVLTTKAPDILNATQFGSIEDSVNTADQVDENTAMHGKLA